MAALKDRAAGRIKFSGVGGPAMTAQGLSSLFPMTDISVMGPREVIPRLPLILKRMRQTANLAITQRPDLVVIIDSPDFTHNVAKKIAKRAPDIPIANYVSPTVWAWRRGRAKAMAGYLKRVLALLPFEPAFFKSQVGLDCVYVGHPAIERVPEPGAGAMFRAERGIGPATPLLALLPGSRVNEVKRLMPTLQKTVMLLREKTPDLAVAIPTVPHVRDLIADAVGAWPFPVTLVEGDEDKAALFDAATAAMAASGTVSLELGLAKVPMVIAYKIDPVAAWTVSRMLKVPSVVLVNLVLDRPSVREFLQEKCTPEALAADLEPLLTDTERRRQALADLEQFRELMGVGGEAPSKRAAAAIMEMLQTPSAP